MNNSTIQKRKRRIQRSRAKVFGTKERPRFAIFRSNRYLYLQLIDDSVGNTIVSVSSKELDAQKLKKTKSELAFLSGELLAKKAKEKNISTVLFDRRFYKYHGRVKAAAEGARSGGLKI